MKLDYLKCFAIDGIPPPEPEYRFWPTRRWRIDFAWPQYMLAVEVEGGVWVKGRHVHPTSFVKDMEKYNHLALAGFRLLRFQPKEVANGSAGRMILDFILRYQEGWK